MSKGPQAGAPCAQSHYAVIVESVKDVEIYALGEVDCVECLRRQIDKHLAIVDVLSARLSSIGGSKS